MAAFDFSAPPEEESCNLFELYHEKSKLNAQSASRTLTSEEVYISSRSFRDSLGQGLPVDFARRPTAFDCVLGERRSVRALNKPMQLADLAAVIWAGAGITAVLQEEEGSAFALRTAPSGGGLYPIDLYVVASHVVGLDSAVYYFHPIKEEYQVIPHADPCAIVRGGFFHQPVAAEAAVIFLLVASFGRSVWKYGERGYRLCLLDAGHLAENLMLKATELGCASLPFAGFHDDLLAGYLGIDGVSEAVVHSLLMGGQNDGSVRVEG